jgi:hypothetical protein
LDAVPVARVVRADGVIVKDDHPEFEIRERKPMKIRPSLGRGPVILACAASLAGTVTVAPSAAATKAVTKCPDKTLSVESQGQPIKLRVRAITTEGGIGCAAAYKALVGALEVSNGWMLSPGNFKAPKGYEARMAKKGGKKIKFATPGG